MSTGSLQAQKHSQIHMRGWDGGWPVVNELMVGLEKWEYGQDMLWGRFDKCEDVNKLMQC